MFHDRVDDLKHVALRTQSVHRRQRSCSQFLFNEYMNSSLLQDVVTAQLVILIIGIFRILYFVVPQKARFRIKFTICSDKMHC